MRRIIHNTTAIAACMSLLAPHLASPRLKCPRPPLTNRWPNPCPCRKPRQRPRRSKIQPPRSQAKRCRPKPRR